VSRASAFNNVVQRISAALGLALLTALLTRQQAQQLADRSALLPPDVVPPHPPGTSPIVGLYGLYQELTRQVFVAGVDDLFVVTAGLTVVGVALALPLRSTLSGRTGRNAVPRQPTVGGGTYPEPARARPPTVATNLPDKVGGL
jgi:hypothetical protein